MSHSLLYYNFNEIFLIGRVPIIDQRKSFLKTLLEGDVQILRHGQRGEGVKDFFTYRYVFVEREMDYFFK